MSEEAKFLHSSTRAISGSDDATHLIEQKERVEQAVVREDPSLILDTSKAFLESIFKTILRDRDSEADLSADMNPLYKSVRDIITLNNDQEACEILKRLTNSVVHHVAELRNKFGAASHGDDGYYENPIQMAEAEMVVQFVDGLAAFIFTKHKEHNDPELAARIHYNDYPEFNDWFDLQNDGYELALSDKHKFSLTASDLLFRADPSAYREILLQYRSTEEDESEENG